MKKRRGRERKEEGRREGKKRKEGREERETHDCLYIFVDV